MFDRWSLMKFHKGSQIEQYHGFSQDYRLRRSYRQLPILHTLKRNIAHHINHCLSLLSRDQEPWLISA